MDELLKRLKAAQLAQPNDPATQQAAAQFALGELQREQSSPVQFPMINTALSNKLNRQGQDDQTPEAVMERKRLAEQATAALMAQQNQRRPLPGE